MAQANAEQRFFPDELADGADGVAERLRIAGAVGQEDAVRLVRQHLFRRRGAGHHRHLAADLHQAARDVPFHAVVQRHHVMVGRPAGQ